MNPRMLYYHMKLAVSGLSLAAVLLSGVLLLITCNLQSWSFVDKLELRHIASLYEVGFSLVPIFLFSQLYSEEVDEGVFGWMLALPFRRWIFLMGRWVMGLLQLSILYIGSLLVIDRFVKPLPWDFFLYEVGVPSLWLGHLVLLATLVLRSSTAGLGVGLAYWVFESISRGAVTKEGYLFLASHSIGESIDSNRLTYLALAAAFLMIGYLMVKPAYYNRK